MYGCGSGSALLVNAEVDSMGGVVDGRVGIGIKTSPRRAAIEKAQAELRQEYDVREERRQELEFLEKGGNPLDFKFGTAASVSVQSTSLANHHIEHFVASEAKGSFALTTSPHGDSVESSGRPGAPTVCEPNSADNFDVENESVEAERNLKHPTRWNNVAPSEQSSQMDGTQNPKESEDSAIFHSYARRNRSRPSRDATRTDMLQSFGGHGSTLPVRKGLRDAKESISETKNQKDQIIHSVSVPKSTTSNGDVVSQIDTSNIQSNMDLDGAQAHALEATTNLPEDGLRKDRLDVADSNIMRDNQHDRSLEIDPQTNPMGIASKEHEHELDLVKEQVILAELECSPCDDVTTENKIASELNGFSDLKRDGTQGQNGITETGRKGLDSESSCTQNSNNQSLDVNDDNNFLVNCKNDISNGILTKLTPEYGGLQNSVPYEKKNEKNEMKAVDNDDSNLVCQSHLGNDTVVKAEEEMQTTGFAIETKCPLNIEGMEQNEHVESEADRKVGNLLGDDSASNREIIPPYRLEASISISTQELTESTLSQQNKNSSVVADPQSYSGSHLKLADKDHEDSILEEARIIEAKRKRIAELSVGTMSFETCNKSHWNFVLEEMAWLANDFAQERLWKMTVAAQICRRVAFTSQLRVEEQNQHRKLKRIAYTLAKAVMQFWHSAEALLNSDDKSIGLENCKHGSRRLDDNEFSENKFGEVNKETGKEFKLQNPWKIHAHAIQGYAVRFLKFNGTPASSVEAEAPATSDRIADGIMEISWNDHLTEESLFYAVPSGAMEIYRISVESHLSHCEANRSFTKTGSSMQEEVDITMYDAAAEFGYHENAYDEEEGETSTYYLHGDFEGSRSMKHDQKKRKNLMKSNSATSYDLGADMPYGLSTIGSHQNTLMGKRPANNLHLGSFPTKRTRTASASRPRVISPFSGAGSAGGLQAPMKTDASSGDTSSFQDDQSTLYGGLQIQKSMEVESVGDFERQLPYDSAETSTKPKKKKKVKHQGSAYEQGWQLDSTVHTEQRDNSKKRVEGQHFDSNGTSGLYRQHSTKKLKIMKQTLDSTYDNMAPMSGSIPSPATSQMSNMSNTNRFMKIINGCNRSKKSKSSKMSAGQPGSGSPWSLFEDQALVVLVHDMGPNWQLVSDAINSTLQFKCIFRKPLECKERHKILMDKGAADGADSGDDSGSSQSYPSTLPGIPKGSARQLFQHLQGPMLEDTLKSHFEKIIVIGKKLHYRRNQNDNQDPRQTAAVHNSHVIALSQVFPNNLNGCVLTPLDLCDATAASPDVHSLGHPGCHASGSPLPNQGDVNSSLRGASGMILGNNSVSASSSAPLNAPVRDGRYNCPRASLPVDEQQRMQHFNQMYSNRNLQPNLPVSSALSGADRGVRMLPGGNGIGMMPGMNRSMPLPRPGYQGMASSSTPNSGSMLSSGIVGIPSPLGMNSGTGSGQGNLMIRPREALHMMRPGHNPEHQRQMMVPEIEMQVKQGNGQGIPAFNGLHTAFANQTTPPHVQAYPGHTQQHQMSAQQPHMLSNPNRSHLQAPNHVAGSQQQAYAIRLAKEKQMQQRLLQQQQQQQQKQQQLAASSALMPHVQPQPQLPMSSSMQNNTQIQQQTSSQPGSMPPFAPSSPLTPVSVQQQQQQKHNLPHHGLNRNPQAGAIGLTNQMGKQRPRQPQQQQQQFQQSGRHHPQQHQSQSSQQAKVLKGMGRGNMIVHRNIPMDPCHLNGLSVTSGNQGTEKEEQIGHSMKGQSLYSGTGLNSTQLSKPFVSQPSNHSHSQPQQKLFSDSTSPPSKSLQQMPSHSDNNTQNQVHLVPSSHALATTHQVVPSPVMASNHQHLQSQPQPHQKQVSQTQLAVQRMSQQNGQVNTDLPSKPQTDRCHTEQQPVKNVSQMSVSTTTTMPQACNDSANVVPIVSSAVALQRKPSESSCDSGMSNRSTQGGSIGSPSLMSPAVLGKQGLGGLRQLSGGLMQHGQSAVAQCKQPQPPQSTKPPSSSQQKLQQQEQLQEQEKLGQQQLPLQQSQQQAQHLQSAQGSLYIRPTNSKLE